MFILDIYNEVRYCVVCDGLCGLVMIWCVYFENFGFVFGDVMLFRYECYIGLLCCLDSLFGVVGSGVFCVIGVMRCGVMMIMSFLLFCW